MADLRRVHAFVSGRVQGVWFRGSTQREAESRGLVGWVRNLPDGRVELVAQGPSEAVERLLAWARHGPPTARVDDLTFEEEPPGPDTTFDVR